MTRIRANCPGCGEVDLRPPDVTLRIVRADDGLVGEGSTYRFLCPDCDELVTKPADERIAQLLTTGGVPIEEFGDIDRLLELLLPPHPEGTIDAPAFTDDDLLDMQNLLKGDDWFEQLLAT
ncbi:hypothetical protein [Egicoccus halophilus]|uniref:Uncharacterized protein n=1 Tax=Egicoccus halophilus TaxID=1670830 RepID=A0A8J3ET84_9ACTN|nr:hypothetical protein [Egicoccus halophilus]GGI04689.1 hypothetical protein GCM10011354_10350 [Egicoccus halophilus]